VVSGHRPDFLPIPGETTALKVIIFAMSINLLIISVSQMKMRYGLTRFIAVAVMAAEAVLCFIVFHNVSTSAAASALLTDVGFPATTAIINAAVILLTLALAKEENSFGGVLSALALITVMMTLCMEINLLFITRFLFFLLPFLILTGVVVYWFTCLHHRVSYDPLLQIYNRDYAHSIIAGHSRVNLGRPFSIAMVDIDHFKAVNDNFGHQVGDLVLHGTAQCIRRNAMPSGITCRYGGEEIIIFFRNTGKDEAFVTCENIRRNVRKEKYPVGGREIAVSVSIGVTMCDDPDIPVERVVRSADEAVYTAKETGRNRVVTGTVKKRIHDPLRRTYLYMKSIGRDRRQPEE
jgi:diguanylate cyclase (GGDEF)-like protein